MMIRSHNTTIAVVLFLLLHTTNSFRDFQKKIPNGNKVLNHPGVGHVAPSGGGARNSFGTAFDQAGRTWTKKLCEADSDGDGLSNGIELGDPSCEWTEGDTPTFDKGIRHPGVKEGEMSQFDSCDTATFETPPPLHSMTAKFNFTNHQVDPVDTKYVCQPMTFPSDKKRWIKKFSAIIEHPSVVHHILIYACSQPVLQSSPNCNDMAATCTSIMYAWAVGANDFCLPNNIGFPVGIPGMTHAVMEIHYDNPGKQENIFDNSGIHMLLTDIEPEHEAGMLMVGDPGKIAGLSPSIAPSMKGVRVPPGETNYEYTTECPSACTNQQISSNQDVIVVATFAHAHQAGRSIQMSRVSANGDDSSIILNSPHFDFDLQQVRPLPPSKYKRIKKGDTLKVTCHYDTMKRGDEITIGGEASDQEMCLGFLVYYPRIETFPACLGVAVRTLPDDASSFAACGTEFHEYPSCGCPERNCLYENTTDCIAKRYLRYNDIAYYNQTYDTKEKLMAYVTTTCQSYTSCYTVRSTPQLKIINSRDGADIGYSRSGLSISSECSLGLSTVLSFVSALQDAAKSCSKMESSDSVSIGCEDPTCNEAMGEVLNHPCLRDVGTYTMFSVVWASLYQAMPGSEGLISSLTEGTAVLIDTMLKCGICTDSRECPIGTTCRCNNEKDWKKSGSSVSCTCEGSAVAKPTTAEIFHGFSNTTRRDDLATFLLGNWSGFCEPMAGTTTTVRETHTFSLGQKYQKITQTFSGHKCQRSALMATTTSTGSYFISSSISGKGAAMGGGPLFLNVTFTTSIKSFPKEGMCSDTCTSWKLGNGRCEDDGAQCAYGTDCTDCGSRKTLPSEDLLNPSPAVCMEGSELCANGVECVYSPWKCDGWCDCSDGSDEATEAAGGSCAMGSTSYGGTCKSFVSTEIDPSRTTLRMLFHPPPSSSNSSSNSSYSVSNGSIFQMQLLVDRDGPGFSLSHTFQNVESDVEPCRWHGNCHQYNASMHDGGLDTWMIVLIIAMSVMFIVACVFCVACCVIPTIRSRMRSKKLQDGECNVDNSEHSSSSSSSSNSDGFEMFATVENPQPGVSTLVL